EARGVSALLHQSPSAEERREAEALISLAAAARTFYATLLGAAPDSPIRLVGVRRGAGFDTAGALLLDHAVFRRQKVDSLTAMQIADAVARLWVGGAAGREAFAGVLRAQFAAGAQRAVTLAGLRERLAGAGGDRLSRLMSSLFDLPTDTDLLVGLPQARGGAWVSNLRNTGSFDVEVTVEAVTD